MELIRMLRTTGMAPACPPVKNAGPLRLRAGLSGNGFTLLEMLLAISIFAMIATVIFSSFNIGIRSWQRGGRDVDFYQRMRATGEVLQRQISSAFPYRITPGELDTSANFLAFFGEPNSLKFVTYANMHKRTGGLSLVELWAEENQGLLLAEAPALATDHATLDAIDLRDPERRVSVSPDVTGISFRYFDQKTDRDEGEWVETWDPRHAGTRLPRFVEISLTFVDQRQTEFEHRLIVPVMTVLL
jgi:general secretion pathway protein J